MRVRCEVAIPRGIRQGRVLVQLRQKEADVLALLPAGGLEDATHQIAGACGRPLLTHLSEHDQIISAELQRNGYWEFAESSLLLSLARPGMTFADVGANIGYYMVLLAEALGPTGQIYAFEPEAQNRQVLSINTLMTHQVCPQAAPVAVFKEAISDRVGEARFHVFERNLGLHSLVHAAHGAAEMRVVPTTTLDALRWPQSGPAVLPRRLDVIKADIQGSELLLLGGAERTIERDRPVLCLEFEPYLSGAETCIGMVDWLRQHGYSSFRVFHSNVNNPHQVLVESARQLSADEVLELLQRKLVGPYGTLLAFPVPAP